MYNIYIHIYIYVYIYGNNVLSSVFLEGARYPGVNGGFSDPRSGHGATNRVSQPTNRNQVVPQFGIAKLVNITPITMVFVGDISIVGFRNQRSHHWVAPP